MTSLGSLLLLLFLTGLAKAVHRMDVIPSIELPFPSPRAHTGMFYGILEPHSLPTSVCPDAALRSINISRESSTACCALNAPHDRDDGEENHDPQCAGAHEVPPLTPAPATW